MPIAFGEIHLHDAVLRRLEFDWKARTLTVDLAVFGSHGTAILSTLTFSGVRHVSIPSEDPWGPSIFVNGNSFSPPDLYKIEVQSDSSFRSECDATFECLASVRVRRPLAVCR